MPSEICSKHDLDLVRKDDKTKQKLVSPNNDRNKVNTNATKTANYLVSFNDIEYSAGNAFSRHSTKNRFTVTSSLESRLLCVLVSS